MLRCSVHTLSNRHLEEEVKVAENLSEKDLTEQNERMQCRGPNPKCQTVRLIPACAVCYISHVEMRVLACPSRRHLPSCCRVVAFTCAGRFSVCSRLSYVSFAALYFFCRQNERRKKMKRGGKKKETERLLKPDRRSMSFMVLSGHTQRV